MSCPAKYADLTDTEIERLIYLCRVHLREELERTELLEENERAEVRTFLKAVMDANSFYLYTEDYSAKSNGSVVAH